MEARADSVVDLIGGVSWLAQLHRADLERLAEGAVVVGWEPGETVFRQDDVGDACYVLERGTMRVMRSLPDGRRIGIGRLVAPCVFGELALLGAGTRTATVEAVGPAGGVALAADDVLGVLRGDPRAAVEVAIALARRMSEMNDRLLSYALGTAAGGVAATLLAWVEARQDQGANTHDVEVVGSTADVARVAGISREAAMRFMQHLELEGAITVRRGRIVVHEPEALSRYLG